MELERLAVMLRPRGAWEAADLGTVMLRHWAAPIYAVWFSLVLPIAVALALTPALSWTQAALILWWLKPLYDRFVLYVLSQAVFGRVPSVRETFRAWRQILTPGLWVYLTLFRWVYYRSVILPLWQLERHNWNSIGKRWKIVQRQTRGHAVLLTVVCANFEVVLWFALIYLVAQLDPRLSSMPGDDSGALSHLFGTDGLLEQSTALGMLVGIAAMSIVEPLYVASGFALYLNRRIRLEGWDLEQTLRRIGHSAAVVLLSILAWVPTPNQVLAADMTPVARVEESVAKQHMRKVLADAEFDYLRGEVSCGPRLKNPPDTPDQPLPRGRETDLSWLAKALRVLAWVLVAALVAWLLVYAAQRIDFGPGRGKPGSLGAQTAFGLDLRPESLPDDIAAAARQLLREGDWLGVLSLLYRGTLSYLVSARKLEILRGDTEGDCVARVRRSAPADLAAFFARLVSAWQYAAYAHRIPARELLAQLIEDWARVCVPPEAPADEVT